MFHSQANASSKQSIGSVKTDDSESFGDEDNLPASSTSFRATAEENSCTTSLGQDDEDFSPKTLPTNRHWEMCCACWGGSTDYYDDTCGGAMTKTKLAEIPEPPKSAVLARSLAKIGSTFEYCYD